MKKVKYSDNFQDNYEYYISEPEGENFDEKFKPELTPKEMLKLGIFGGAYFIGVDNLIPSDLPKDWFEGVKLSENGNRKELNFYGINASQPLEIWQKKGWIHPQDPHGWFQWYCRYYIGRRSEDDERQIKRWKAIRRHIGAIQKNCEKGNPECRPKQRQAVLHWAYDSRKI